MSDLAKAVLHRLDKKYDAKGSAPAGYAPAENEDPFTVQFNPTTLRLQYQNNTDNGGKTAKTQKRQYFAAHPATLSFDLEFDTAEATSGERSATGAVSPADVRDLTAKVRRFIEPQGAEGAQPPVLRFVWGRFVFNGIVTQISEELDYFAPDGTPLRAKLGVSISEQNLKYEGKLEGAGARNDKAASVPGAGQRDRLQDGTGAAPGRSGTRDTEKVETAQGGESVQQLAARIGGDPAAWRSLMNELGSPLGLPPGTPVQVGPELTGSGGVGRAAGFAAGSSSSITEALAQALGRVAPEPSGPAPADVSDPLEAVGFALSQAGGTAAAVAQVAAEATDRAAAAARAAFALPARAPTDRPAAVDARALAYGWGLPLRAQAHPDTLADLAEGGRRSLAARARPAEITAPAAGAGLAPWRQLPPSVPARAEADREQRRRDTRPSTMRWKPGGVVT